MSDRARHEFRFFVPGVGEAGGTLRLDDRDTHHARVLHGARTGERVQVVDGAGVVWRAAFAGTDGTVVLEERLGELEPEPAIELYAFVTVGGRTDELVDGAVQAGATRVVPVVGATRDHAKVAQRRDRLERIAAAAAKQAKRAAVPTIDAPIAASDLAALAPGIVVDPDASQPLDLVVAAAGAGDPIRLLVGAADGFPPGLVAQLEAAGWCRGRLGHTILRAELAAPVAVAITAMHVPRT